MKLLVITTIFVKYQLLAFLSVKGWIGRLYNK